MNEIIYNKSIDKSILKSMNIYIEDSVVIGENVKISANVCLVGNTYVESNCEITGNSVLSNCALGKNCKVISSYLEDCCFKENCQIGPFAHVRGVSSFGSNNKIGNFVEIKNSVVGDNNKMSHLAYIGDAKIGNNCNIGCGVIFCNYDGNKKSKCVIGDNVFIGSNSNLIAPVEIEDNAYIAGGSTINKNVSKNEFAIARERQTNKKDFKNPYIKNDM